MDWRMDWIRALRPGDEVLDCRNRRRTIVRIEDETEPQNDVLACTTWMLAMFSMHLAYAFHAVTSGFATVVTERVVYFADGTSCRATQCLDPV